jgi:Secretion system C-terminal sorting domain
MKKLYILCVCALFSTTIFAQLPPAITACKKGDSTIITFDLSKNCRKADGQLAAMDTLGKRTQIGFHSGPNEWTSNGVDWDNAKAVRANRISGTGRTSKFEVRLPTLATYYNLTTPAITQIKFVFNDGPGSTKTWDHSGKDSTSTGDCQDFKLPVTSLATCTAASQDLRSEMSVRTSPNPFKDVTYITFDNAAGKNFSLSISDITGRVVRNINNITTDFVEIKRENLATGVYFAVLRDAGGKFLTEKLVVQ